MEKVVAPKELNLGCLPCLCMLSEFILAINLWFRHSCSKRFFTVCVCALRASQVALVVKNTGASASRRKKHVFHPWVRKIPWRRKWQSTPVFLPRESHGQRGLKGYRPQSLKESDLMEATQHMLSHSVVFCSLRPRGLKPARLFCPWDFFLGKNSGVGCHFLLQGIFLTQGLNPRLLHQQVDSLQLIHMRSTICVNGVNRIHVLKHSCRKPNGVKPLNQTFFFI